VDRAVVQIGDREDLGAERDQVPDDDRAEEQPRSQKARGCSVDASLD
jgi:hypothetical protein